MTQRQRDVISTPEMLVDQRLQTNVGQNVAAIRDERPVSQFGFDVFDAAAGLEQDRLIDEVDRFPVVTVFRKCFGEFFRQSVGVYKNLVDAEVDQMIERESDERLLTNWDKRLGQFFREGAKSRAETGAEDECLFDPGHGVTNSEWQRKRSGAAAFRSGKTSASSLSRLCSRSQSSQFLPCS